MNLTQNLKQEQLFTWWTEIVTEQPYCIYYFGPFVSEQEAQEFLPGYLEDLKQEGCQVVLIQTKQCQPKELTILQEEWQDSQLKETINGICNLENVFVKY